MQYQDVNFMGWFLSGMVAEGEWWLVGLLCAHIVVDGAILVIFALHSCGVLQLWEVVAKEAVLYY